MAPVNRKRDLESLAFDSPYGVCSTHSFSPWKPSMAPLLRGIFVCAICGRIVPIESCKIDEDGRAVHAGCYVLRILQRSRRENITDVLAEDDRRKRKDAIRKPDI
jgi:hypothetical protein